MSITSISALALVPASLVSASLVPASLVPASLVPASLVQFTLDDFERIKNNGFSYTMSPETMAIIQALADQVGAPEYIKTPQFNKVDMKDTSQNNRKKRGGQKIFEINDEDWESVRNFKTTLIVKKEGIAAVIDQIRKHLNKMTEKTYSSLKDNIIKEIEGLAEGILAEGDIVNIEDEEFITEINKIGEALFTIASGNSFYSTMYAKLYKELMEKFAFMKTIFETNFRKFNTLFNDFVYCDPNKDYDQFCQNTKVNEKRRALSLFYVNLMKEQLISTVEIGKILQQLKENLLAAIKETDKKNIVDEMVEIIYIIIVNGHAQLKDVDTYDDIEEFVNTMAGLKPSAYPSITNKTIFKFMDILDTL
jgi:hypothetical protein